MHTNQGVRSSRCIVTRSLVGVALLATGLMSRPIAAQSYGASGLWDTTHNCWPDASMHANHVVIKVGGQPVGRVLMWYNPGCPIPFEYESTGCTEEAAPVESCGNLPIGCTGQPQARSPRLWNPADNSVIYLRTPEGTQPECEMINDCNGHAGMADGKLMVIGGGCGPTHADTDVLIFDPSRIEDPDNPSTSPWSTQTVMGNDRWYPTLTTLPDGRLIAFSGASGVDGEDDYIMVNVPEMFNPHTQSWSTLPLKAMFLYPFMFVVPDGRIFWAGHGMNTSVLDISTATPSWTNLTAHTDPDLFCGAGSAVMYRPGKVLKCGGFDGTECAPTGITATVDFNIIPPGQTVPNWDTPTPTLAMTTPRKDHNLVLTPDGNIVAVGGQDACVDVCPGSGVVCGDCDPVLSAEWFRFADDGSALGWTDLADMTIPRGYHSTAMLLPDARVIVSGGENWFGTGYPSGRSAQIYKPPYYFNTVNNSEAVRPVITTAPEKITYGGTFTVTMPSGQTIQRVSLVRVGSPSHGFDQNQRFVPLTFTTCSDTTKLLIDAPPSGNIAPPGYYMLYILAAPTSMTTHRVPSIAKYVLVGPCNGDLNNDCSVGGLDNGILLGQWTGASTYSPCPPFLSGDLNMDCKVNGLDIALLTGYWGTCPGSCGTQSCTSGGSAPMGGGAAPEEGGGDEVELMLLTGWLLAGDFESIFAYYGVPYPG